MTDLWVSGFIAILVSMTLFNPTHQHSPVQLTLYKTPFHVDEAVTDNGMVSELLRSQENSLEGKPGQGYYIPVLIGTPPQKLNVLVDTGSSNFALAAAKHDDVDKFFHSDRSETFRSLGTTVFVPYTQGNWKGLLGNDVVRLPSMPNITVRADLVGIDSSEKFFINGSNWQGILGMAYAAIARPDSSVEPFFDAFTKQTGLPNVFSMQLCGTVDRSSGQEVEMGGSMILGGVDTGLYKEPIYYSPLYKEWYYEIIIADILVNEQSLQMDCKEYNFDKTIVDSGTTNLRLPKKVFEELVRVLKNKTKLPDLPPDEFWLGIDILCWPKGGTPLQMFPSVKLALLMAENTTFNLVIAPRQYLRTIGEQNTEQECFKFAIASSTTGTVIGAVIMEGYYVIFDRSNRTIGWAQTKCQRAGTSTAESSTIEGPFQNNVSEHACAYVKPTNNQATLTMVAYIMAGVCGLCVVPVIISLIQWQINRWRQSPRKQEESQVNEGDVHGLLNNVVTS